MYGRLYKYLLENNYRYEKQFGFQAAHSADHAVIQLISQILQNLMKTSTQLEFLLT